MALVWHYLKEAPWKKSKGCSLLLEILWLITSFANICGFSYMHLNAERVVFKVLQKSQVSYA